MRRLLLTWGILAIVSMVVYGFTGFRFWSQIQGEPDLFRAAVVFAFHVGGVAALIARVDL